MREMARIQTFPDNVEILGGNSNVQKQLGNAVPSAIGELIGKQIMIQFFGKRIDPKLTLIPVRKLNSLEPQHVKKISKDYQHLLA
jgi:DNA (cytosine-5)-methyltransferase 1